MQWQDAVNSPLPDKANKSQSFLKETPQSAQNPNQTYSSEENEEQKEDYSRRNSHDPKSYNPQQRQSASPSKQRSRFSAVGQMVMAPSPQKKSGLSKQFKFATSKFKTEMKVQIPNPSDILSPTSVENTNSVELKPHQKVTSKVSIFTK